MICEEEKKTVEPMAQWLEETLFSEWPRELMN